jgi:hypothetical protein
MSTRTHEYEISFSTGSSGTIKVWWDGKRVACDDPAFHASLKKENIMGMYASDGIEFLKALPTRYNNGYINCSPVKDSDKND